MRPRFTIRKTALEYYDFDYWAKLTPEERYWLLRFCVGYYNGNPKNSRLFLSGRHRKGCFAANNARNRDMFNQWQRVSLDVVEITDENKIGEDNNE